MAERNREYNGTGRLALDAETREQIAARLSQEAILQGQRALVGLLAVPASFALGLAATVTWATAFLERGFETFERSLDQVTRASGELLGPSHEADQARA